MSRKKGSKNKPKNKPNFGWIYSLVDPRNNKVFYIGLTTQPVLNRFYNHLYESKVKSRKNVLKERIISKIQKLGLNPIVNKLCYTSIEHLGYMEKIYITLYKSLYLTNKTSGGDYNPLIDNEPEKIKLICEKISKTKKKAFKEKIKKEAIALGISVNEYLHIKQKIKKLKSQQYSKQKFVLDKNAKAIREKRKIEREKNLIEFKRKSAEEKRQWYASLSEEEKQERRIKDSNYRKNKRASETLEQKEQRRLKSRIRNKMKKQLVT